MSEDVSQKLVLVVNQCMKRRAYPSDVNDDEWELIKPLIPIHQGVGHPQIVDLREIVNAILYWTDNKINLRTVSKHR